MLYLGRRETYGFVHPDNVQGFLRDGPPARPKSSREAAPQGRTMSDLIETALRLLLRLRRKREILAALPSFRSGGALVDIADRNALSMQWKVDSARSRCNVLVYAADAGSQFHARCRDWLERKRARPDV